MNHSNSGIGKNNYESLYDSVELKKEVDEVALPRKVSMFNQQTEETPKYID